MSETACVTCSESINCVSQPETINCGPQCNKSDIVFCVPHRAQLESSNKNSKLTLSGTVDYNSQLSSSETNVPPRDQTPTWELP